MLRRYWHIGLGLAGSMLVAGCHHPVPSNSAKPVAQAASIQEAPKPQKASEPDKLAEAHAHYSAAVIHDMNEESEAALEEYYKAAKGDPANETLTLEVARRFQQSKQLEKALDLLVRSATRPDASGSVFAQLGFLYSQVGKFDLAIVANRTAIKKTPSSFAGYQNLYLNYIQNKQPGEALKVLDEAAKQPHLEIEFLISLSELYANFGVQEPSRKEAAQAKALTMLNRAEAMHPSNAPLQLKLAEGFNTLGDTKKAAQLYLELLKKLPDVPVLRERVRSKLAEIYLRGSDHKAAVEQLEALIKDDPTNAQAYYFLASIVLEDKLFDQAIDYFNKAILLSPDMEQAYYDLAMAQMGLNKTSEALATLDKARQKFSQNFVVEFLSGLAFTRQKAYTEAIQHFTNAEVIAKATEPKRLTHLFYFQLGAAYERKGEYEQAENSFEKSLQLAPDFAEAMNYLGYMWAEHGWKLEKARELIEKALKLEPKNAAYLDSLGWVLFKLNQPAQALDAVLKAVELSEEPDATVQDHLGDIYSALNKPEKAKEAWRKSLSLEDNEQVRKKLGADSGAK
jgi:tetratricopeptide (TPR) repeat protein